MDYEKKYKDALDRASKLRVQNPFDTVWQMVEHIFPELQESENERMRKEFCKDIRTFIPNEKANKYIAWLEEQENTPDKEYVFRPVAGDTIEKAAERAVELDGKVVLAFNGAYIPVDNKTKDEIVAEYRNWVKKQGEQHSPVDINKMVDEFADTEVEGYGFPSMIEVDAYRKGIEDALGK